MKKAKGKNKFLNFLKSKLFIFNVLAAIALVIIIVIIVNFSLKIYTKHGKSVTVPEFVGEQADKALASIEENGFQYVIVDTVFDDKFPKGAITEQNPEAGSLVKSGRKIYVKINSQETEQISMPQFIGMSVKMVNSMAENYGLKVGNLKYVPDISVNVVIRQLYRGRDIEPGIKIKKGATIDLVLGLGLSDKTTNVPTLIGLTKKEASNLLLDLYLNIGAVVYDNTVRSSQDSTNAKIYRQSPRASTINQVNLGYSVDIWLTKDQSVIDEAIDETNAKLSEEENENTDE
ncbi:MAG: PASTA domain-containing protein [Bacteroidota bacterium]|jgi:beta-lactam-binding protein with PASTA domain|nr:PASTA domain-containing protein [Bacteroidales bacterium]MDI9535521.1 PASTA domain-containing protein [Bacteroidota bacterium]OQC44224.1 MAG: Serine/threonine-protein kinase PK-1 [Bacteroidetes bacterium ADurb.Bin028]NLP20781.1 PASTA domain-containing protein [Bacteroidales bacterium]HNY43523.1 PASTA domain-containing protein [Bacteroidales bacterium]